MNETLQIILEWKNETSKRAGKRAARQISIIRDLKKSGYSVDKFNRQYASGFKDNGYVNNATSDIVIGQESVGKRRKTSNGRHKHYNQIARMVSKKVGLKDADSMYDDSKDIFIK